jgi:hypothetical protein
MGIIEGIRITATFMGFLYNGKNLDDDNYMFSFSYDGKSYLWLELEPNVTGYNMPHHISLHHANKHLIDQKIFCWITIYRRDTVRQYETF